MRGLDHGLVSGVYLRSHGKASARLDQLPCNQLAELASLRTPGVRETRTRYGLGKCHREVRSIGI